MVNSRHRSSQRVDDDYETRTSRHSQMNQQPTSDDMSQTVRDSRDLLNKLKQNDSQNDWAQIDQQPRHPSDESTQSSLTSSPLGPGPPLNKRRKQLDQTSTGHDVDAPASQRQPSDQHNSGSVPKGSRSSEQGSTAASDPVPTSSPGIRFDPEGGAQPRDKYGDSVALPSGYYGIILGSEHGAPDSDQTAPGPQLLLSDPPVPASDPVPAPPTIEPPIATSDLDGPPPWVNRGVDPDIEMGPPPRVECTTENFLRAFDAKYGTRILRHLHWFNQYDIQIEEIDQCMSIEGYQCPLTAEERDQLLVYHAGYALALSHLQIGIIK